LFVLNLVLSQNHGSTLRAPRITWGPAPGEPVARFAFEGAARFECAVDAVRFVPCASPTSYGVLPVGRHICMVRGVSPAGARGDIATFGCVVKRPLRRRSGGSGGHSSGTSVAVAGDPLPVSLEGDLPGLLSPGRGGAIRSGSRIPTRTRSV
jgi:hypothetical protein